jgi:uncharacterized protein YwqG
MIHLGGMLMIKVKRIMIYIIILMISTLLFGCADIHLKSSTVINENESGSVKLQIIYDDFISSKLKEDIIDLEWAKENGYLFNRYLKDNMNVEEITYEFKNIKELEQKISSSGLATMTYSKKILMGENIFTIDLKFNKSAIDNLIKTNTNNDEKIYNYIKNVKFTNKVNVFGNIVKSNATVDIDESTKEWTYKLSQIDNDTAMLCYFIIK